MYESSFTYPNDVKHFTPVLFATEPSAGQFQWAAGFVVCPKNQSCDIVVFREDGVVDYRSDCWHADDPRCKSNPEMYRQFGRGVFKLAPAEQERKTGADEIYRLRRDLRDLNARVQKLESGVRPMNEAGTQPSVNSKPRKEALLAE